MHKPITKKQKRVLENIIEYIKINNYPPSVRDLGERLGYASTSTVLGHMVRLKEKGFITWEDSKPRTLKILKTE